MDNVLDSSIFQFFLLLCHGIFHENTDCISYAHRHDTVGSCREFRWTRNMMEKIQFHHPTEEKLIRIFFYCTRQSKSTHARARAQTRCHRREV